MLLVSKSGESCETPLRGHLTRSRLSWSERRTIDPTTKDRQGGDVGSQYRSAIFYHNEEQKKLAEEGVAAETKRRGKQVVTQIAPADESKTDGKWFVAEDYHQKYLEKGGQCSAKGDKTAIRCYG